MVDVEIATTDRYNHLIEGVARLVPDFPGPVFVQPGFEFNGPWNGYTPKAYPQAFRKFVEDFWAAGAVNVVFI